MRSPISNLEAHPNNTGPIPPKSAGGLHWRFVAYCDEEVDAGLYGYGHTEADACADYLRNCAEEICSECTHDECECQDEHDCILFYSFDIGDPDYSSLIYLTSSNLISPLEYGGSESNVTHDTWLELNNNGEEDEIKF